MGDFGKIIAVLAEAEAEFIVIGGLAGIIHGAARVTYDVDAVYSRAKENIPKLAAALKPFSPYLRGAPPGLPFCFDERTIRNGLNFTLTTQIGELDLLGEATGGGTYPALLPHTIWIEAYGVRFRCASLHALITLKRAAGRPKDLEALAELEVLLAEQLP